MDAMVAGITIPTAIVGTTTGTATRGATAGAPVGGGGLDAVTCGAGGGRRHVAPSPAAGAGRP